MIVILIEKEKQNEKIKQLTLESLYPIAFQMPLLKNA